MGYVRVRQDETGHEFTIDETAPLDGLTVIDKPAVDAHDVPLPPKHRVPRRAARKTPAGEGASTENGREATKKE